MTPDTRSYYYAAYALLAVLYIGYVVFLWWRAEKSRAQSK